MLGSLAALPALTVPVLAATDPHVAYRERLHVAYGERRLSRPVMNVAYHGSLEDAAATLVLRRTWALCDEVLTLPTPTTLAGLGVVGLAGAINFEGMASLEGGTKFEEDDRAIALIRAILSVTREPLPADWGGWGDEPDYFNIDSNYLNSGIGSLPAWALAKAREARA